MPQKHEFTIEMDDIMLELLVSIAMIAIGRLLVNRSLLKEQTTFEDLIGHKRRPNDVEPLIKITIGNKPAYSVITKLIVILWSIIGISVSYTHLTLPTILLV